MDNLTKLSLVVIMSIAVYCVLTLPMIIAFFTMNIETGEYIGLIYPTWVCYTIGIVSGLISARISIKLIERIESRNEN